MEQQDRKCIHRWQSVNYDSYKILICKHCKTVKE